MVAALIWAWAGSALHLLDLHFLGTLGLVPWHEDGRSSCSSRGGGDLFFRRRWSASFATTWEGVAASEN
jgi:hypothetical protein